LEGEINVHHFRSCPDSKSHRQHRDFLCRRAALFAAATVTASAETGSCSHSSFALDATSGTDVPARGATYPGLSSEFAYPAAFGDLLTAIIALVTIPIVLRGTAFAKPAVWFFNIFGMLDLVTAIILATIHNAPVAMGPAYWIPAFWVPLLLVTHYVTFVVLWKHWKGAP